MTTQEGKTVFIEYSTALKGQHFMTVVQTTGHKRQIIGRIFREYDKENGKTNYVAKDWDGVPLFKDTHDLSTLKKKFIEHGKFLSHIIPKVTQEKQHGRSLLEKSGRIKELKKTQEVKNQTQNIEKGKEQINKSPKNEKALKSESRHNSLVMMERERDLEQIRSSHQQPEIEKEQNDQDNSEKSDREMELEQVRDENDDRGQDLEMDL